MTGESRSMEQNVLERSGLMKDFLSEKMCESSLRVF